MKLLLKLLIYTSSSLLSLTIRAESHNVIPLSQKTSQEYDLDRSFYSKTTAVQGILIASSAQVTDTAHLETAYLFDRLMSELREPIAQRIREKKVLCLLVGHQELTSDLPQFKSDKTGKDLDFYNWRQRGFLTKINDRYVVLFAEEDVMEYVGGMQIESILIHEFGHVIHGVGFDEALKKQWTRAYMTAKAKGLWNDGRAAQRFRRVEGDTPVLLLDALVESFPEQPRSLLINCLNGGDVLVNGEATHAFVKVTEKDQVLIQFGGQKECYASKNRGEYFAEAIQCWYNTNRTMDHDHNHIHTRAQLKDYDPGLAQLCQDVLGDHEWRFTSPRKRAGSGHLRHYQPEKAPIVEELAHIREAGLDYYDDYWSGYWKRLKEKYPSPLE